MAFTIILRKALDSIQFKVEATDLQRAYADAQAKRQEIFGGANDVGITVIEDGGATFGLGMAPR